LLATAAFTRKGFFVSERKEEPVISKAELEGLWENVEPSAIAEAFSVTRATVYKYGRIYGLPSRSAMNAKKKDEAAPSLAEIKTACEAIQRTWSDEERERRVVGGRHLHNRWTVPSLRHPCDDGHRFQASGMFVPPCGFNSKKVR
jgi:hypothetical protein